MSDRLNLETLKKQFKDLPSNDYRLCSEKTDKPSGLLLGAEKLIIEFSNLAGSEIKNLRKREYLLVNDSVQLYLFGANHSTTIHQPIAFFPIDESKFRGSGFIKFDYEANPYFTKLAFFNREDDSRGYIMTNTKTGDQSNLLALYQFDDGDSRTSIVKAGKLKQFGSSEFGWRKPDIDIDEKLIWQRSIRINDKGKSIPILESVHQLTGEIFSLKKRMLDLNIGFKRVQ